MLQAFSRGPCTVHNCCRWTVGRIGSPNYIWAHRYLPPIQTLLSTGYTHAFGTSSALPPVSDVQFPLPDYQSLGRLFSQRCIAQRETRNLRGNGIIPKMISETSVIIRMKACGTHLASHTFIR